MATTNLTNRLKTPGVYIEEISKLPPSIAQVETAIPAFIGYTEKARDGRERDLTRVPYRISSLLEYELYFGKGPKEKGIEVTVSEEGGKVKVTASLKAELRSKFRMYHALQPFFLNGGGPCWIVSTGDYESSGGELRKADLSDGMAATEKINEITLYVYPEAQQLDNPDDYYGHYLETIDLCEKLQDRFTILDVWNNRDGERWSEDIKKLRDTVPSGTDRLKYAASYFPNLETTLDFESAGDDQVKVSNRGTNVSLAGLKKIDNALYFRALTAIAAIPCNMPPSPAIAGIYARVDSARGVWKAPANVGVDAVIEPSILLTDDDQATLNVDTVDGKSINAIRFFSGRGVLVWGARTLAGNDNEWRYVPVRRFFNMVEESTKNATNQFVFHPNDRNTWTRVRSMIENFLTMQWKAGALMGTTTQEAYYVRVGLGETMTEVDIWEGRMIVEIGMAVVRPAEFIILQFSHKMLSES